MKYRLYALGFGLLTHALFAIAVALMAYSLYYGLQFGFGPFRGYARLLSNAVLIIQFPFVHSFFLSRRGKKALKRLAPKAIASDLSTTSYAFVASLQLICVFGLWSPGGSVIWEAEGALLGAFILLYAVSWGLLLKAMVDAGLSLQTGCLGWSAVFRGVRPKFDGFPSTGLFCFIRQPIYLSFALILWTGPVWTLDKVFLTSVWTLYCVLGPLLKEKRYEEFYGDAFKNYKRKVPYIIPTTFG